MNKKVYFKPYPAIRYLDMDPVICEIKKHKNIDLVSTHTDLRFIVKNYKLIITSRATSTLSWIVASKRPVIFINNFYHSRLDKKTFLDFSEAFFVFDERERNFHQNLYNFLSKPIEYIQKEWDKKNIQRKKVCQNYFGKNKKDVGKFILKQLTYEEKLISND